MGKSKFRQPGNAMLPTGGGGNGPAAVAAAMSFEISEPLCKVCQSPYRAQIDRCLVMGWTQKSVIDLFNQILGESHFTKDGMSRHKNGHLSIEDAAIRRVIEARARQFKIDVDEAADGLLTRQAVLDTVIIRGMEQMRSGKVAVEARDVLAATQLLDKMEAEWKETAIDEMLKEFKAFTDSVREIVTDDDILRRLLTMKTEDRYAVIWGTFEARLDVRPTLELDPGPIVGEIEVKVNDDETEEEE